MHFTSSLAHAEDSNLCTEFYGGTKSKWTYEDRKVKWVETQLNGKDNFFAIAYVTEFGMLYLNMSLVTKDGKEKSRNLRGREFIERALDYYRSQGIHVAGIKGWWVLNHKHGPLAEPFDKQLQNSEHESINLKDYWAHRKQPNDKDAAARTWTYQMAARLGYSEVAKVEEYKPQLAYTAVMVTFLPKVIDNTILKKQVFGEKKEAEIILQDDFLPYHAEIGSDEPAKYGLMRIFELNMPQEMLIEIFVKNSQVASDLNLLGIKIVGIEQRVTYNESGHVSEKHVVLKVQQP